ncbi:hypothetical protein [uncultured Muriicola sp.]|uniref:hypothetical protein n=1 Tax=uncultured Muriicola sp. TaxID=1583102 RepID=UPI002604F7F8|nr:hypothetical protein [uncultured Muriicola sp.]
MISGIFGKTKPINYVLLLGFIFILYWFVYFYVSNNSIEPAVLVWQSLVLLILLFSVLVINFVVNRNQITSANSYVALYFILLILIFSRSVADNNAIFCSFFLLLACRRLLSLRSLKNIKLKIMDATLWVLVASLFYDWTILFLLLVYIAIYIYEPKNLKNWLVPLVSIIVFVLLSYAVLILANNEGYLLQHYQFALDNIQEVFADWKLNIKLIIYALLIAITALAVFLKSGKLGLGRIINLRVISIYFSISILVIILSLMAGDLPVLISFFPGAVFLGKYVEMIKRKNIKEMVLYASVFTAFLVFAADILIK